MTEEKHGWGRPWVGLRCLTGGIWSLPRLLAGVTSGPSHTSLQDGWVDRQMDKQRYEGERERRPSSSALGVEHPLRRKEDKRQKEAPPTRLLCLLDKPLLLLTLPCPTGQSVGRIKVGQTVTGGG